MLTHAKKAPTMLNFTIASNYSGYQCCKQTV